MLLCADPQIKTELVADGSVQTLEYELDIPRSSWVRSRLPTREPPLLLSAGIPLCTPDRGTGSCANGKADRQRKGTPLFAQRPFA